MKIGYYCESPVDQAAIAIFVAGLLNQAPESISMDLEAHSVPAFFATLGGVLRGVHYNSDADGLVIVVDADDTDMHDLEHDKDPSSVGNCRMCQVRNIIAKAKHQMKPRSGRPELKVVIGVAVPEIEAWYLSGKNHQVGEAAWRASLSSEKRHLNKQQLKSMVYGTDRSSLEYQTECAVREARRIIQNFAAIEAAFPIGFGMMAREIRAWATPKA